ncbi:hypothetical protein Tco_0172182, partial [Tanacetum coccineum]
EEDHEVPAEEKPLLPIDSPTAESPGYVIESDPEEYEDDETEDGPVNYPMDGGDGDDGDSSRDDANDEDEDEEDEEDEEEEEHIALADSTSLFSHLREQSLLYHHPPLTLLLGLGLPSDPRLPYPFHQRQRCTAPHAHSPPLPPSSGCPTHIQTLRIASTQALIDVVTTALPSPSLPPLPPSLSIPPPVDRRDDIPEFEQPPRKRLYLSTIGSKYEIGESSTARPTRGRGVDYGFVSTVD